MPRPNKPINPGRLDGEVSSSRPYSWSKHNSEPGSSETRGASSSIEVRVDDITIVDDVDTDEAPAPPDATKYQSRGTAAHLIYEDGVLQPAKVRFEEQWSTDRSIEGRTYRRVDTMTRVEIPL